MSRSLSSLLLTLALCAAALPAALASGFAQPRPGLHTGGQPMPEQLEQLAQGGVRTVIDLRTPGEDRGFDQAAHAEALGLRYITLPIDTADGLTPANATVLKQLLEDSGDGDVLLHCGSGNRVGALLAMIAAQHEGATPEEALALGRQAGLTSLEPRVAEKLGVVASEDEPPAPANPSPAQ